VNKILAHFIIHNENNLNLRIINSERLLDEINPIHFFLFSSFSILSKEAPLTHNDLLKATEALQTNMNYLWVIISAALIFLCKLDSFVLNQVWLLCLLKMLKAL